MIFNLADRRHGCVSEPWIVLVGRKYSWPSWNNQNPCCEMFVTSRAEVTVHSRMISSRRSSTILRSLFNSRCFRPTKSAKATVGSSQNLASPAGDLT